jgi:D-methionine transport system ATP-binding protein
VIELNKVYKTFIRDNVKVEALKDIDLEISKGDIFGIIGVSGSGKSTLIRLVNYLEEPTSGSVVINGKDLSTLKPNELCELRKQIGIVPQHFDLLESKTVFDNIAIQLILNGNTKDNIKERVLEVLKFVGLESKAQSYPNELSGGQKQRVGIASALVTNPSILICDEATSEIDPQTTSSILELLKEINEKYNITILIITHEMNIIKEICNRVAVMEEGKIIEQGSVLDIFGDPQQDTTKKFVKAVIQDDIPKSVLKVVNGDSQNKIILKLKFIGDNSTDAILSELCKRFNVELNILFANVTELQGITLGNIIVALNGEDDVLAKAKEFIVKQGVITEELVN